MLTRDTVNALDAIADTLPADESLAVRRLATTVSAVVSFAEALNRYSENWSTATPGTYGAGYGDGLDLSADLLRVIDEALHNYVVTQVKA